MLSWKKLIHHHRSTKNNVLKKLAEKCYREHLENGLDGCQKYKPIAIDPELLENTKETTCNIFESGPDMDGVEHPFSDRLSAPYTKSLLKVSEYDNQHPVTQQLNEHFGRTFGHTIRNTQEPGQMVGPHSDTNKQFTDAYADAYGKDFDPHEMCKAIVFLDDWSQGQVLTFGTSALVNWKKNDCITFPWFMPHSTSNASGFDRPVLTYVGI